MQNNNLIEKAAQISVSAHKEQRRKTDGSPYAVHPIMVAFLLDRHGFSDDVIAAALVHDVLEDTDFPREEIINILGQDILEIVDKVSEDKSLEWKARKEKYIETVKQSNEKVKAVSIGDKIHNAKSLIAFHKEHGAETWDKFNKPKDLKLWFEKEMLKAFKETWDHPLIAEYEKLVNEMESLD